jgi:hypothetical protein
MKAGYLFSCDFTLILNSSKRLPGGFISRYFKASYNTDKPGDKAPGEHNDKERGESKDPFTKVIAFR